MKPAARKRTQRVAQPHAQQARGWGGAREGAGRRAKGPTPSERHTTRPELAARHPVHVTSRVAKPMRSLRKRRAYAALHRALAVSLARDDFRIVHVAVLPRRLELIVEASDKTALARGMQGFQVSAARALNRQARRRGNVFVDRYRMRILATRVDVRDAIGRLPLLRTQAWPQTWLLRVESAPIVRRRFIHTRADEDSHSQQESAAKRPRAFVARGSGRRHPSG